MLLAYFLCDELNTWKLLSYWLFEGGAPFPQLFIKKLFCIFIILKIFWNLKPASASLPETSNNDRMHLLQ